MNLPAPSDSSSKTELPFRKMTFLPELIVCMSTTECSSASPTKANFHVTRRFACLKSLPTYCTSKKRRSGSGRFERERDMVEGKEGRSRDPTHRL